jgi:23S rRNA (cytosine1962-C5)-methyltransferase
MTDPDVGDSRPAPTTQSPPSVTLRARGAARVRGLHPWVFRDDVLDPGESSNGDTVRLVDGTGRTCGYAFYSTQSKIAVRRIHREDRPPDAEYWDRTLARAQRFREKTVEAGATAYRWLFAESDGIPGLVADRYGDHLVVQCQTAAAERLVESLAPAILARSGACSILARDDSAARRLEGLAPRVVQIAGRTPEEIEVREGPVLYRVDPWRGQKTGAFLDQRENRLRAGVLCRGRVLDAFCYQGGFALHAARHADEVLAIDSSESAVARGRADAEANGLTRIRFVQAKVFDELKRLAQRGETFDAIVLDPPAFAKSRRDVLAAERAYHEINRRALRLLAPEGTLITCSCSYNLSEERFERIVTDAAAETGRDLRLLERRTQAEDHPLRLGFPESRYLKCLVLGVM